MSLTLSNAIVEVRSALNEATGIFWSDIEIQNWIQEGCRNFSSKTLMVEGSDDLDPLIENQLSYESADETWISDIIEPYSALYNDGSNKYKGLVKIHPRQIGNLATSASGPPKYYCLFNRMIYILPLSSAAVAGTGTIHMLYSKETDDITEIKDEYQHLPVIYAVAKCKQKDMKFAEATNLMAQFMKEASFERQDKHSRETDSIEDFRINKRQTKGR